MYRRVAFFLTVLAAEVLCLLGLRYGRLTPSELGLARIATLYLPGLVILVLAFVWVRRTGLFTAAELGLRPTDWMRQRGVLGWRYALLLFLSFIVTAILHAVPPINYSLLNGLSYAEFVGEVRSHEWREVFARAKAPIGASEVALTWTKMCFLAPLSEEALYRAFFMPAVLPRLNLHVAAILSGAVFHAVHVYVYGYSPAPDYFLGGWAFAYVFMYLGLAGAVVCHAGGNFGIWLLAVFVEFWA